MSEEYEVVFKKVKPLLYQLDDMGKKDRSTLIRFNKNVLKVNDSSDITALMITGKKKVLRPLKREQETNSGEPVDVSGASQAQSDNESGTGRRKKSLLGRVKKESTPIVNNIKYQGKTARTFEIKEDEGTFEVDDVIGRDKRAPRGQRVVSQYVDRTPPRHEGESSSDFEKRRRHPSHLPQKVAGRYVETETMTPAKRIREAKEWVGAKVERVRESGVVKKAGKAADTYVAVGDELGGRVLYSGRGKYSSKDSAVHQARQKLVKGFNERYDRAAAGYNEFQRDARGIRSPVSMSSDVLGLRVGRQGNTRIRRKRKYVEYYGDPYRGTGYGSVQGKSRGGASRDQPFNYL
jgi:hypothetical protein